MKKLHPKTFKKVYLIGVYTSILLSITLSILGIIIFPEDIKSQTFIISIIFLVLGFITFAIGIVIIIKGRKRYLHLQKEIYDLELTKPIEQLNPLHVKWYKTNIYNVMKEGNTISFTDEGLVLDDIDLIPWENIKAAEFIDDYIALGEEPYKEELWEGIFVEIDYMAIKLLERYLGFKISTDRLEAEQERYKEILQSTEMWHYNWPLFIEKCLFILVMMLLGICVSLFIAVKGQNQSLGITIANLIVIPSLLFVYPRLFGDAWKCSFIISKEGFGYAKGRFKILFFWDDIKSVTIEKRKIIITYVDDENDINTLEVPRNRLLVSRLKDYKTKYSLIFKLTEQSS